MTRSELTVAPGDDATLLYLIKQVELAVRFHLDAAVSDAGLTALQYTALTVLERHPGMTSAELARNSFVRAQTMAQMTKSLEVAGLIRREADPNSRRQYLIFLNEEGEQMVRSLRMPVEDVERRMIAGLTPSDIGKLREMLRACRLSLSGSDPH